MWQQIIQLSVIVGAILTLVKASMSLNNVAVNLNKKNENIDKIPEIVTELKNLDKSNIKLIESNEVRQKEIQLLSEKLEGYQSNFNSIHQLVLSEARQTLLNEMESGIKNKVVTPERKLVLGELYQNYINNGGNGTVKHMWEEQYMNIECGV